MKDCVVLANDKLKLQSLLAPASFRGSLMLVGLVGSHAQVALRRLNRWSSLSSAVPPGRPVGSPALVTALVCDHAGSSRRTPN